MFDFGEPVLVPQPRMWRSASGEVVVRGLDVRSLPVGLDAYTGRVHQLLSLVAGPSEGRVVPVVFREGRFPSEGYELRIDRSEVEIGASSARGVLHAARTLVDLWDQANGALREVNISDSPTFPVRGIFVESFVGTDSMCLDDWKLLIDRMGQLKFNTIGVSIYNCWDIHHEGDRSEYLFTPLDDFPALRSTQRIVTWDPVGERECEYRYLPSMYQDDFFGEIVLYAAAQGIEVIPHLGGPGHSTLIPRAVPGVSALDEDGRPTGYGYCVTHPTAKKTLARIVGALVRQHLRPNGISRLHVAGDEYYPISNVDPFDRARVVSPYCRCSECKKLDPGQQLVEYLTIIGQALARDGIGMIHWHDSLIREDALDIYLARLEKLGLPAPVIAWWNYNDPALRPVTNRTEAWSCPTTGLASFMFPQDFSSNIETMLRRGYEAGASGAFAYSLPVESDLANYAFLADLSWNFEGSGGVSGFRLRWASRTCPENAQAAGSALAQVSTVTACYPLVMYILNHVFPFFATGLGGSKAYPDDLLHVFSVVQPPMAEVLRQTIETLRDAASQMPVGRDLYLWPNPMNVWRREHNRMADFLELFLDILAVARSGSVDIGGLQERSIEVLRDTAREGTACWLPFILRERWGLIREIGPVLHRLRSGGGVSASETWYAWNL
ncbi:glycoside hydrolase family 20 zincin-like fold domain-containing protein [Prauserella muralis]|uniref:glycoside hydrolase family 20 zincin-like fold domain-containing protein n=1 Tax=Prauserella muralis TaxID=588067 RepID=UPI000DD39E1C|nr:glycoside hydrolase family 20 zincin-like fold domain-containing protein [Prauserella muralis]TWE29421.1 glycosyl hydrolase family 20 [Prauserella muralis]